jgi:hypothetical protein
MNFIDRHPKITAAVFFTGENAGDIRAMGVNAVAVAESRVKISSPLEIVLANPGNWIVVTEPNRVKVMPDEAFTAIYVPHGPQTPAKPVIPGIQERPKKVKPPKADSE